MKATIDLMTRSMTITDLSSTIWANLPDSGADFRFLSRFQDQAMRQFLGLLWQAEGIRELILHPYVPAGEPGESSAEEGTRIDGRNAGPTL